MSEHEREIRHALHALLSPYRPDGVELTDRTTLNHQLGIHGTAFEELMASLRSEFGFDDSSLFRPDYVLDEQSWAAADELGVRVGEHLLPLYAGDLVRAILYGAWPPPAVVAEEEESFEAEDEIAFDDEYGARG